MEKEEYTKKKNNDTRIFNQYLLMDINVYHEQCHLCHISCINPVRLITIFVNMRIGNINYNVDRVVGQNICSSFLNDLFTSRFLFLLHACKFMNLFREQQLISAFFLFFLFLSFW